MTGLPSVGCAGRACIFFLMGTLLITASVVVFGIYFTILQITSSTSHTEVVPTYIIAVSLGLSGILVILLFWKRWKPLVVCSLLSVIISAILCIETVILTGTHVIQPMLYMDPCTAVKPSTCVCYSPYERTVLYLEYLESASAIYTYYDAANCEEITTTLLHMIYALVFIYSVAFFLCVVTCALIGVVLRLQKSEKRNQSQFDDVFSVEGSILSFPSDTTDQRQISQIHAVPPTTLPLHANPRAIENEYSPMDKVQLRSIAGRPLSWDMEKGGACQEDTSNNGWGDHKRKTKTRRERAVTLHNLDTRELMLILNLQMRYLQESGEKGGNKNPNQESVDTNEIQKPDLTKNHNLLKNLSVKQMEALLQNYQDASKPNPDLATKSLKSPQSDFHKIDHKIDPDFQAGLIKLSLFGDPDKKLNNLNRSKTPGPFRSENSDFVTAQRMMNIRDCKSTPPIRGHPYDDFNDLYHENDDLNLDLIKVNVTNKDGDAKMPLSPSDNESIGKMDRVGKFHDDRRKIGVNRTNVGVQMRKFNHENGQDNIKVANPILHDQIRLRNQPNQNIGITKIFYPNTKCGNSIFYDGQNVSLSPTPVTVGPNVGPNVGPMVGPNMGPNGPKVDYCYSYDESTIDSRVSSGTRNTGSSNNSKNTLLGGSDNGALSPGAFSTSSLNSDRSNYNTQLVDGKKPPPYCKPPPYGKNSSDKVHKSPQKFDHKSPQKLDHKSPKKRNSQKNRNDNLINIDKYMGSGDEQFNSVSKLESADRNFDNYVVMLPLKSKTLHTPGKYGAKHSVNTAGNLDVKTGVLNAKIRRNSGPKTGGNSYINEVLNMDNDASNFPINLINIDSEKQLVYRPNDSAISRSLTDFDVTNPNAFQQPEHNYINHAITPIHTNIIRQSPQEITQISNKNTSQNHKSIIQNHTSSINNPNSKSIIQKSPNRSIKSPSKLQIRTNPYTAFLPYNRLGSQSQNDLPSHDLIEMSDFNDNVEILQEKLDIDNTERWYRTSPRTNVKFSRSCSFNNGKAGNDIANEVGKIYQNNHRYNINNMDQETSQNNINFSGNVAKNNNLSRNKTNFEQHDQNISTNRNNIQMPNSDISIKNIQKFEASTSRNIQNFETANFSDLESVTSDIFPVARNQLESQSSDIVYAGLGKLQQSDDDDDVFGENYENARLLFQNKFQDGVQHSNNVNQNGAEYTFKQDLSFDNNYNISNCDCIETEFDTSSQNSMSKSLTPPKKPPRMFEDKNSFNPTSHITNRTTDVISPSPKQDLYLESRNKTSQSQMKTSESQSRIPTSIILQSHTGHKIISPSKNIMKSNRNPMESTKKLPNSSVPKAITYQPHTNHLRKDIHNLQKPQENSRGIIINKNEQIHHHQKLVKSSQNDLPKNFANKNYTPSGVTVSMMSNSANQQMVGSKIIKDVANPRYGQTVLVLDSDEDEQTMETVI